MMDLSDKKVLILGTGVMGTHYTNKLMEIGIAPERVVGVDIDAEKFATVLNKVPAANGMVFVESQPDRPLSDFVDFSEIGPVFLCTNTPSHHRLLVELMNNGVRQIFCEKPLSLNMSGVNDVRKALMRTGTKIYTAFLMNFSLAVMHMIERMRDEDLILIEGRADWGKNRMYDHRPTSGDLEDESVHPVGIFHTLLSASGVNIKSINIGARLSHLKYIDDAIQEKAHKADPSFPLRVNSSAFINEMIQVENVPFDVLLNTTSSYIKHKQVRRVECVFAKRDDPEQPVLAVEFNFDTPEGDTIEVTRLQEKEVEPILHFKVDKLFSETEAFLRFCAEGYRDPRLTGYFEARMSVQVTEAIIASHEIGGNVIEAFGKKDVQLRDLMKFG